LEDPDGNVVQVWDFFESGDGARKGVAAPALARRAKSRGTASARRRKVRWYR
jgi:hypothetical protein